MENKGSITQQQYMEQKISLSHTISAGETYSFEVTIPSNSKALLKGYGYSWFVSNTFQLRAGSSTLPSRTDQEGSVAMPVIYGTPYNVNSGEKISLTITNGDSAAHTYYAIFYVLCNRIIEVNSVGGEIIMATGSASGTPSAVSIYNSTLSTAANVTALGLDVNPKSPTTLRAGATTTTAATALVLSSSTAISEVTLQADVNNTEACLIGNATTQPVTLDAGQSIKLLISNLNLVYIKRSGATNVTINWIGS